MFKLFFFIFIFLFGNSYADVYLRLPDSIETTELNKGVKKTQNRYNSFGDVNSQYKGKLRYKPSDEMYKNNRLSRYFTSVSIMFNNNSFKTATDKDTGNITNFNERNSFNNSVSAEFGHYFSNSIFLSLEYFEYNGGNSSLKYFNKNNVPGEVHLNHKGKAFMFNIGTENNYSKVIPFFGAGIGIFKSDFSETSANNYIQGIDNKIEIKSLNIPMYQIFAGFDISIGSDMFITLEYKYFNFLKDLELRRTYNGSEYNYNIDLKRKNNSFVVGFKYLW